MQYQLIKIQIMQFQFNYSLNLIAYFLIKIKLLGI